MKYALLICLFGIGLLAGYLIFRSPKSSVDSLSVAEEHQFFRTQMLWGLTDSKDPAKEQRRKEAVEEINKILARHKCAKCSLKIGMDDGRLTVDHTPVSGTVQVPSPALDKIQH